MKSLIYTVLGLFLLTSTVIAGEGTTPSELIRSGLDQVTSVLRDKSFGQEEKKRRVTKIITPLFDFSLMAKLALGKKHWSGLSKEKQQQFSERFIKRMKETYLNRLTLYNDEKVDYGEPVLAKKKAQIPTFLVTKDNKISMLYKLYQTKKGWKIYDTEIQGVSVIKTYRSQFDEILQKGSFKDLMKKLEKPEQA